MNRTTRTLPPRHRVMELERAGNASNCLRGAPDGMKRIGISRDATDGGYGDGKISV
jgi:hypothetical protein